MEPNAFDSAQDLWVFACGSLMWRPEFRFIERVEARNSKVNAVTMPLYDYAPTSGHCDRCHGRFEVHQRIADRKLTRCPTCK